MKKVNILLVEDNEGDILLIREALEERKIANNLTAITNGADALSYIFKQGSYKNAETPDLIILDINLPKKNGHEVLHTIKEDENVKKIPVIMLTTSSSEIDVMKSYKHHANCFITKPVDVNDFIEAVTKIEQFWLSIVTLP